MAEKSPIDLDALTVPELTALILAAEDKRKEKFEGAKKALMVEIEQKAAALGMSVGDLYGAPSGVAVRRPRKPRKDAGQTASIKYRGPDGAEWSGRGRRPNWLTEALSHGRSVDDFRI